MSVHSQLDPEFKREKVLEVSQHTGFKWAVGGLATTASAVFAGLHFSPKFRNLTNVGVRTALVIMPPFFLYNFVTEQMMISATRDPELHGIYPPGHEKDKAPKAQPVPKLNWYHQLANTAYNNPFGTLVVAGVPVIGGLFYQQSVAHPGAKMSNRILSTRVLGQASVLGLLLGTMFFRDYMQNNGGLYVAEVEGGAPEREYKVKPHQ